MRQQPEVVAQTRQRLVDAFCQLYAQKPLEKITVREVVAKAGCSRSNFYLYYSNLAELRDEIEDDLLAAIRQVMERETSPEKDDFLALFLQLYTDHEVELAAILGDYGSLRFQTRFKQAFVQAFPTVFAVKQDRTFPYLVEYHISTILSLFQLWIKRGKDLAPEELLAMIDSLLLR